MHKTGIIDELGISELLLPKVINDALMANDRVKYFFSLIQMAKNHADNSNENFSNLVDERLASNVQDNRFETILDQIYNCMDEMLAPIRITESQNYVSKEDNRADSTINTILGESYHSFFSRYEVLKRQIAADNKDIVTSICIDTITSGDRENKQDSFHLLIMDIHKSLNKLQLHISEEVLDGANVYGVTEDDKNQVRAFMKGLNETANLSADVFPIPY